MVNSRNPRTHVVQCWPEWEISGRERTIVLCVETDLELQPERKGFDPLLLDALIDEAIQLMHANASPIDRIRIVPATSPRIDRNGRSHASRAAG